MQQSQARTQNRTESDCDLSDDGEEFESDNEMAFPARRMCVNDLSALMEESHQVVPAQPVRKDNFVSLRCSWSM